MIWIVKLKQAILTDFSKKHVSQTTFILKQKRLASNNENFYAQI